MLRSLSAILKAAGFVAMVAAVVTYAAVTRISVYRNTTEIELLRDRLEAITTLQRAADEAQSDRLTALEKTVYVPPEPASPARRPAALEQWMVNAANELRKRVKALEDWRYKEEQQQ
jgi:hypothetical protein